MSFLFISSEVVFQETTAKGARLEVTMLELNKPSDQNTEYCIEEGDVIAESLVGDPIFYGTNWKNQHKNDGEPIGIVESAKKIGNKIKGIINIWAPELINIIKRGGKFLFSIGGVAKFAELIEKGGKKVMRMIGAICNHLQMVPLGTKVGFPNAKVERVIEINETVMFISEEEEDIVDTLITEAIGNAAVMVFGRTI